MKWAAIGAAVLVASATVFADQVINDDLIVDGDLCVGLDCADGEVFDFETLRMKGDEPALRFDDTSSSASFPSNDWLVGVTDNAMSTPGQFYIRDLSGSGIVLLLQAGASGGIALGVDASIVEGAVSVGALGAERRVSNVADGVADNDAVTIGQFNAYTTALDQQVLALDPDNLLNAELAELRDRIAAINARIEALQDGGQ